MWRAAVVVVAAVLFLPGCGSGHVSVVDEGDSVFRGPGGYAAHPYRAAMHSAQVRYYKAMAGAFQLAEREAAGMTATDLFASLRKGWKGFGYIAAGQGGSYTIPGYREQSMRFALGTLPADTCKAVTGQIADAYGDLRESLKHGSRPKHVEAAKGAEEWQQTWLRRNRNDC